MLGTLNELASVVARHGVRHVIVGFPQVDDPTLERLVERCQQLGLQTTVLPRLASRINHRTRFEHLGATPVLTISAVDPDGFGMGLKYLLYRVVAALLLLLLLLAPVLLAIALAVRLSSQGPILFGQARAGQDGQVFETLKFRTMRIREPGEAARPDEVGDSAPGGVEGVDRRTPVGRALRRITLDELPQLFQRTERLDEPGRSASRAPGVRGGVPRTLCGLSGSPARAAGDHGLGPGQRLPGQDADPRSGRLDNFYITHWSPGMDAKIFVKTLRAIFKGGSE